MLSTENELDPLMERAEAGDASARERLLALHEERLKRVVRVRIDRCMAARVDPSDVVQEAFIKAWAKLPGYLQERPIAFYPWLRRIAWDRLVELHRAHVGAARRSVKRERRHAPALPHRSAAELWNPAIRSEA